LSGSPWQSIINDYKHSYYACRIFLHAEPAGEKIRHFRGLPALHPAYGTLLDTAGYRLQWDSNKYF